MSSRKQKHFIVPYNSVTNDSPISIGPIPSVNNFRMGWFRDSRECERRNHIPHLTPTNSNHDKWITAYDTQLRHMLNIVATTIHEEYPKNNIRWYKNQNIEKNFSYVIYHCSSKYISPYLDNSPSKKVEEDNKWENF